MDRKKLLENAGYLSTKIVAELFSEGFINEKEYDICDEIVAEVLGDFSFLLSKEIEQITNKERWVDIRRFIQKHNIKITKEQFKELKSLHE